MMKMISKTIVPIAVVLLAACQSEEPQNKPVTPEARVALKVSKSGYAGNSAVNEGKISKVHAYAFRDGALAMSRGNEGDSVLFYLPSGRYDIMAFANCVNLPYEPADSDEIWDTPIYLRDNEPESPMMSGTGYDVDVTGDYSVDMKLKRYLAKFNLTVKDSIADSFYARYTFTVLDFYMANVPGENNLGLTAYPGTDGLWYNKMEHKSEVMDYLLSSGSLNKSMVNGDTVMFIPTVYSFPNNTVDPRDRSMTEWSARSTRLVIKAKLGEYTYYYPVTICPVKRNTAYNVYVVISGPGLTNPEDPLMPQYLRVKIDIADWVDEAPIDAEI